MKTTLLHYALSLLLFSIALKTRAQQDLVAHWKLDEGTGTNVADASGLGNNGKFADNPIWTNGVVNGGLSFDGVNDYLEVPHSASLGITDDITVAAWIKRAALQKYGGILAKTDGDNVWDYDFYFDGDTLRFWADAQSPQAAVAARTVSDMEWHHVAATRAADTVTFYIDGLEAGTVSVTGNSNENDLPVHIGTDGPQYSANSMFKGIIDDVRLYKRALTAAEILALYPNLPFTITTQPADVTSATGFTAQFGVRMLTSFGVTYQWYKGQTALAGANSADYITGSLTAQDSASQYSVVLKNIAGLSLTSRVATLTVSAPVLSPGFLKREVYKNITGTQVTDLTGSDRFPASPDKTGVVAGFESPTDIDDQYGQRVSGFITPQETARYVFLIATDDGGELWLSTDENPANKALIAWEPQWNPARAWTATTRRNTDAPENRSEPIPLTAGKRYYVEALQKEGGGGDNLGVTAIKEGDPLPAAGSPPLQGTWIGASTPPATGTITITKQPVDAATVAGKTATFTVEATHSALGTLGALVYQWQRDGKDIFRANASSYTTPILTASDDGAAFRCVVYGQGGVNVASQAAKVIVSSDVTAPSVLQVSALIDPATGSATEVTILFDEPLDQASAETRANYSIDNGAVAISSAALQPLFKRVLLGIAPLTPGVDHTLVIKGVADRSPARNAISQAQKTFQASSLVLRFTFDDPAHVTLSSTALADNAVLLDRPTPVAGLSNGALSFDGVNDYLEVANTPPLGIIGDITIAAWVKRNAVLDYGGILAKTDGANTWDYDLYFAGGANTVHFYADGQSPQDAISTGVVADAEWHHVAVTRSQDNVIFYIDGKESGTVGVTGPLADNPFPVRIGTDGPAYNASSMFNGILDDVRVYNTALSAAEIAALAQAPTSTAPTLRVSRAGSNVVLAWPTASAGFNLEASSALAPASWSTAGGTPVIAGADNTVTLAIGTGKQFYRLRKP